MPQRKRTWHSIAIVTAAAATLAAATNPLRGADLLRDDFDAAALDQNKWSIGTWGLGRTQLGFTPALSGGAARLRLDTYNPSNPGGTFRGSEILSDQLFTRGSGLEYEARVRVNPLPSGLVTSFFTYIALPGSPPLADEIDFEFLTKHINNSPSPASDPVLATTWNNFRTDGSNFGDPNVHTSVNVAVPNLNLAEFNTVKIRWLPDRVQWYVNDVPIRTSEFAVPDQPAPIRANLWAPNTDWQDAYAATLQPTANAAQNQTHLYDIDYIAVRRIFSPVTGAGANRVFTDNFNNGNVANSNATNGFWTQRNQGGSSVTETNAAPADAAEPLKLRAAGAGFPHAQIASTVRPEFNLFRTPVAIEATGLGFSSTSHSTAVNSIDKSILRFVLTPQGLAAGTESEYTVADALSLRVEGTNLIALGTKTNAPNANTEFSNNLVNQVMPGPVRRVRLVAHGSFYFLQVEHDVSNTDSTQTTTEFTGPVTLNLADWSATGDAAMILQGQLNNAGAAENMTALVESLAVSAVRPAWDVNAGGNWSGAAHWTDRPAPNYRGAHAQFTGAIDAARTVNTDVAVTAGRLTFDNATAGYTIAGPGTITLDTFIDDARIEVLSGAHTIAAPVALARNAVIDVAAASSLTLSGDLAGQNFGVTKTGAGGASVKHVRAGALAVTGGRLTVPPGAGNAGTSNVASLAISGGAAVDLKDHNLVVRNGSAGTWNGTTYTGVAGLVRAGRNGGAWNGVNALVTTMPDAINNGDLTTLAVATAGQLGLTTFAGQSVDAANVLVMYTYGGDANLDGKVDIDDYGQIDSNASKSGSVFGWHAGDFNYDGKINIDDYGIIDANVTRQGASLASSLAAAPGVAGVAAIPEPASIALLSVAVGTAIVRRRREFHGPNRK